MALLTRESIAANNHLPHTDVDCPELGGAVRIRTMRGKDKEALSVAMSKANDGDAGFMSLLVARCAVDESGQLLFDSPEAAGEINGIALQKLFTAALELNRMGRFEEDAVKNSGAVPSGESSSGSP